MNWHLANPALILGLLGVSIPVVIHLLNRRRVTVIDWGAMQFLDLGRRARRKFQLTEMLLMLGRMALLALVALAVARPFWTADRAVAGAGENAAPGDGPKRDVVLILDASDSMQRRLGNTTPYDQAIASARRFVARLRPGDSVAVLLAKDRVQPLVAPPSFDFAKVDAALTDPPPPKGSSDLPAAIGEAFRLLESGENPARDVILLTDGQKLPWRLGEPRRWDLLRDLHASLQKQSGTTPRLWSVAFGAGQTPEGADGAVGPLELTRGLVPPGLPITVRTTVTNAGPGELTRTAELLVDGRVVPGLAQAVGPIPAGSRSPLVFRTTIADPGAHVLTVRFVPGDDPLPANDEAARPIEVTEALPVLLVDGEPGLEPLSSETDFLRAALAPSGDDTPQVRATVVPASEFGPESLQGQRVVVLANVDRLDPSQSAAVARFVAEGGGVLVAPGDRTDADFANEQFYRNGSGWLPASLGELRGDSNRREPIAHPAPPSFHGPSLAPFGQGDAPPLGEVDLFAYHVLSPATRAPAAAVLARLDTGDPWIVERPYRQGRAILLAGPVDAEGGTLPVNPDFVPWAHELVYHLADPDPGSQTIRPGEPIVLDLDPAPPEDLTSLTVTTPTGETARAAIERGGGKVRARLDAAGEPGIYRIALPEPPGGMAYVAVAGDPRESDLDPLAPDDAKALADGWPLTFAPDPNRLTGQIFASGSTARHPIWRWLVLLALTGLCLEVWFTRRLVRGRGIADLGTDA